MDHYGPETYGERVADVYDEWYTMPDPVPECALLVELANGGRALELGIGTGRIALPLAAAGVEVHGVDASPAIVAQLHGKPGGEQIPVTIGDMAEMPVEGEFSLVFVVFNTLFMLVTQEAQVRCFENAAAHLLPGGRFLVHAFAPDTSRIEHGQSLAVRSAGLDAVRLNASTYDLAAQRVDTTQVRITESGTRLVHARMRFAYVSELDLMARIAGLELESRWGSFAREPFDGDSDFHVSVYRKPLT